jgi:acetyl esterase/lipase
MKKTIEVELTSADILPFEDQPVLIGVELMQKLKQAGVPVATVIWPFRVAHGRLNMFVDVHGIVAVWEGEVDEQSLPKIETSSAESTAEKIAEAKPDEGESLW